MAGAKNSNFAEKLTPYLQQKLVETSKKYGIDSDEYRAFERQYLKSENEDNIEELYSIIANCIDTVYTQEEEFKMDDYSEEERTEFFESLTQEHFLKIQTFFNTIPYTYYNLHYDCEHCDHVEDMELRGINNFFT